MSLNCRGRLLDLTRPVVMGIINTTPDSFYQGSRKQSQEAVLEQAGKMLREGATILDIGGMSSRPGAEPVPEAEELARVLPAIEAIAKAHPEALISIDTWRASVARGAVAAGAHIVNDISAGRFDEQLYATVGELGVPYILMHMQGEPSTMQEAPTYEDVVEEVTDFFERELRKLQEAGVSDIVLDVGFGFGKSVAHNYRLLARMQEFETVFGRQLLAGVSRKSMICKVLKVNPDRALNGTTALHMAALERGARILRVHDVREAVECVKLWEALEEAG